MDSRNLDELTDFERSVGAVSIASEDLRVGDVLVILKECHRVDRIKPYVGPQVDDGTFPPGTRVACYAGEREITLTSPRCRILPRSDPQ